jgi:hypothetical protein
MKLHEILNEGMTFGPARRIVKNGKTYITGEEWWSKQERECPFCHGMGYQTWPDGKHDCGYCYGTGKTKEHVSSAPELQVSNANGYAIQEMLGLDPDYSGHIENKDLPAVIRRLIQVKNTSIGDYTADPTIEKPSMQRLPDEDGVARIGKRGPTMIGGGRTYAQVERYINKLIEIIQFAQKNGADVSWG